MYRFAILFCSFYSNNETKRFVSLFLCDDCCDCVIVIVLGCDSLLLQTNTLWIPVVYYQYWKAVLLRNTTTTIPFLVFSFQTDTTE